MILGPVQVVTRETRTTRAPVINTKKVEVRRMEEGDVSGDTWNRKTSLLMSVKEETLSSFTNVHNPGKRLTVLKD